MRVEDEDAFTTETEGRVAEYDLAGLAPRLRSHNLLLVGAARDQIASLPNIVIRCLESCGRRTRGCTMRAWIGPARAMRWIEEAAML